jgi:hypothetical protein
MLKLRRAIVLDAGSSAEGPEQDLMVELSGAAGEVRAAIADVALMGRAEVGDEVIVNVQALDLGLGSGGFDIVHVNLTRGLSGDGESGANVMKLNYTSLQHAVRPVEDDRLSLPLEGPVAVLALHSQLAPVAWSFSQQAPGSRLGYVQTEGGALPGGHSRTVRALRECGLLAGHLTAGAAFGGEGDAITTAGALHHGLHALGWDAAVCGPGPGIIGSSSPLGHGGMSALDSAHAALALGCPTLLVARMSGADGRARHRGISHHTLTVLDMLLEPVTVALPAGMRSPVGNDLRAGLSAVFGDAPPGRVSDRGTGDGEGGDSEGGNSEGDDGESGDGGGVAVGVSASAVEVQRPVRITRHDWRRAFVDLPAYAACGLPTETMGRGLLEDPLFFGAALAGGTALAELNAGLHGQGATA